MYMNCIMCLSFMSSNYMMYHELLKVKKKLSVLSLTGVCLGLKEKIMMHDIVLPTGIKSLAVGERARESINSCYSINKRSMVM